jgi:hypothetical protein
MPPSDAQRRSSKWRGVAIEHSLRPEQNVTGIARKREPTLQAFDRQFARSRLTSCILGTHG